MKQKIKKIQIKDFRKQDIDFLDKNKVFGWNELWEKSICNHSIDNDDNQLRWHLSRISYLAGYLTAKGVPEQEIEKLIDNHLKEEIAKIDEEKINKIINNKKVN